MALMSLSRRVVVTTLVVTATVLAGSALLAARQTLRPMSLADLLTAVRVADAQLSPDGQTVLYQRTTTDLTANRRHSEIWAVPAAGGAPMALLTSARNDTTARWSPDGTRIAFLSTREGGSQVWIANADGTGARKLTAMPGGVMPPLVWSPDGSRLAVVADVYPDCTGPGANACNQKKMDEAEANPVKARSLTRLFYRHWDEWRGALRHHVFVVPVAGGAALDVTPGDFDSPPTQQEDGGVAWSADGQSVLFVSNREGHDREAWTTNTDVFQVAATGGAPKRLTPNPASDHQPTMTKDGRFLIVRAQRRPGFESDRFWLDVYDVTNGATRTVFRTPDLSVGDYALSPDGQTIYFTASSKATDNLYAVPFAGGTPREILHGGAISGISVGAASVAFSRATMRAPADIHIAPLAGGTSTPLTRENAGWLSQVATAVPESRTVAGAGGTPVQYWVVKPPMFDASKKYPVVFLIHGGPQGEWGDGWSYRWNPTLWAAQGWVVVAPNPRGSFGFGQSFVDEVSQDWGGRVMGDLTAVFDDAITLPYVDAARQGIAGASYGGYAVNWLIGHTGRFKAAVTHDGVFNMESMALATEELWFSEWEAGGPATSAAARANFARWSPHLFADKITTPTFVITNELDFRVPVDQGLQLFTALRRHGVPSEALVFPDEGHWVLKPQNSQLWHQKVFGWMATHLK